MKKYLISTLTAAAAMAVPAFSAELLGSWDFTSMDIGTTGSIAASTGDLVLSTGSSVASTNYGNSLSITSSSSQSHETTVDLSSLSISTEEGISVVITITDLASGTVVNAIWSAITTSGAEFAAAIGETASGHTGTTTRDAWFAGNGTDGNIKLSDDNETFTLTYPMTITMTFIGDTLTLYKDGEYVGSGTITNYSASTINGVAIGSWDGSSTGNELPTLGISSLEIYKGDVMAVPEPSMFGLMFGLGAIGLVATRRRRR